MWEADRTQRMLKLLAAGRRRLGGAEPPRAYCVCVRASVRASADLFPRTRVAFPCSWLLLPLSVIVIIADDMFPPFFAADGVPVVGIRVSLWYGWNQQNTHPPLPISLPTFGWAPPPPPPPPIPVGLGFARIQRRETNVVV
ncbi:hypothetical protein LY76DRAFT_106514 [Colletotrichum caudatum]|nr:hypothetical protein LY76DRAFT_106514 [Colletotrichum caudatum]